MSTDPAKLRATREADWAAAMRALGGLCVLTSLPVAGLLAVSVHIMIDRNDTGNVALALVSLTIQLSWTVLGVALCTRAKWALPGALALGYGQAAVSFAVLASVSAAALIDPIDGPGASFSLALALNLLLIPLAFFLALTRSAMRIANRIAISEKPRPGSFSRNREL